MTTPAIPYRMRILWKCDTASYQDWFYNGGSYIITQTFYYKVEIDPFVTVPVDWVIVSKHQGYRYPETDTVRKTDISTEIITDAKTTETDGTWTFILKTITLTASAIGITATTTIPVNGACISGDWQSSDWFEMGGGNSLIFGFLPQEGHPHAA